MPVLTKNSSEETGASYDHVGSNPGSEALELDPDDEELESLGSNLSVSAMGGHVMSGLKIHAYRCRVLQQHK